MSSTLYLSTLKLSRIAFLTWAIILLAYAFLVTYMYNYVKAVAGIQEMMEALPEGLKQAVGTAELDFDQFAGGVLDIRIYISTEYLTWVPLMLLIYTVFYCGGLVSREAERRTLDLLLAQPLERYTLVLSKMAAFLTMVVILLSVSWIGIGFGLTLIDVSLDLGRLALAHVIILPFVLAVSGYCTLMSCLYLDPRRSLAVSGSIAAGMYLLDIIAFSLGSFQWLENFSLVHHIDLLPVLLWGTVNWTGITIHLAVAVATFVAAIALFERRDLTY